MFGDNFPKIFADDSPVDVQRKIEMITDLKKDSEGNYEKKTIVFAILTPRSLISQRENEQRITKI